MTSWLGLLVEERRSRGFGVVNGVWFGVASEDSTLDLFSVKGGAKRAESGSSRRTRVGMRDISEGDGEGGVAGW